MTARDDEPSKRANARWSWQFFVAVGILFGFAVLVITMLSTSAGSELSWERRVYVFGAVEAVVFAAVGWIFGREVHRAAVISAKDEADHAKKQAAAASDRADRKAIEAMDAMVAAAEEQMKNKALAAAVRNTRRSTHGSGPQDSSLNARRAEVDVATDLWSFVEELERLPTTDPRRGDQADQPS